MDFMRELHSGVRWIVLLFGLLGLLKMVVGLATSGQFGRTDRTLLSLYNAAIGIQWLLGILFFVWVIVANGVNGYINSVGIVVTHFIVMTLAVGAAAAFIGRARRSEENAQKFLMGLLAILASTTLVVAGVTIVGGWA